MNPAVEYKPWDIVSQILVALKEEARAGVSLLDLNAIAETMIQDAGARSINKGYTVPDIKEPFPAAVCISVNSAIAHGIPTEYKLKNGDFVSFDLGVEKDGVCGDAALTVSIGEITNREQRLLDTAYKALYEGIAQVKPGAPIKNIGQAIESFVFRQGYKVIRSLCGHTIGEKMHMKPDIYHFYDDRYTPFLTEGQMICIEPHVTFDDSWGVRHQNGWTYATRNGKKSAFFEHQILVTKTGYQILTSHI